MEPCPNTEAVRPAALHSRRRVLTERRKDVQFVIVQPKACGRDPYDCVRLAIENEPHADCRGVCGEMALPKTVTEDRHGRRPRPILLWQEHASRRDVYTQEGE